jgi:hypothetical protein
MGVRPGDPRDIYGQISVNAICADECSRFSLDVLSRFDLVDAFEKDSVTVLTSLHEEAIRDYRTDTVFALAELSYLAGMRARSKGSGHPIRIFLHRFSTPTSILSAAMDTRLPTRMIAASVWPATCTTAPWPKP